MGADTDFAVGMSLSSNTQKLTSAVSSLPALLEKKRLIDMHTSIATAILDQIKLRKLDLFFELEEKVMSRQNLGDKSLADILQDPEAGTPEDKLRLFIIYYICSQNSSKEEIDSLSAILESEGCDLSAVKYLQRIKSLQQMTTPMSTAAATNDYAGGGTKTVSMFSKLMSQAGIMKLCRG